MRPRVKFAGLPTRSDAVPAGFLLLAAPSDEYFPPPFARRIARGKLLRSLRSNSAKNVARRSGGLRKD